MAFRLSDRDRAASQAAAAIRQANRAQADYDQRMGQAQSSMEAAQSKPMGGLESVLAGIGEKFSDWGNTIGNIGRTVIGGVAEPFRKAETDKITADDSARRNEIAKRYGFSSYSEAANSDRASQDFWNEIKGVTEATQQRLKNKMESDRNSLGNVRDIDLNTAKGQALSTASDVLQALGPIGNVVGGVTEGVGSSYKNAAGGTDSDVWGGDNLGRTLGNAAIGGVTAFIGDKVGGKLASKAPGDGILSRAIHSNVGRGTIAGAAAGATGGGLGAALNGGDILSGTLQGAQSGAIGGGTMAGVMGLAGRGIDKLNNKFNQPDVPPELQTAANRAAREAANDIVEMPTARALEDALQMPSKSMVDDVTEMYTNPQMRKVYVQDASDNGPVTVNRKARSQYRLPERSGSTLDGILSPDNETQLPNAKKPTNKYANMTDIEVLDAIAGAENGKPYSDLADAIRRREFLPNEAADAMEVLKDNLSKETYDEIRSGIQERLDLDNMFSNTSYGVRKSDLPKLNRDEYYYDTVGRLGNKGNGNIRADDIPKSMYDRLRNDASKNYLGGNLSDNETILRELFGSAANGKTKSELYDMYQSVAEAPGPRSMDMDDIVSAVTNDAYNNNLGDRALSEIVAPYRRDAQPISRQIGVQGAPSIADSIDVSSPNRGQLIQDIMPAQRRQAQPQVQAQPIREIPTPRTPAQPVVDEPIAVTDRAEFDRRYKADNYRTKAAQRTLAQFGNVDAPAKRSAKAIETAKFMNGLGLFKKGDIDYAAETVTGRNGAIAQAVTKAAQDADPVKINFKNVSEGVQRGLATSSLTDAKKKAVATSINAYNERLSSLANPDGTISPNDVLNTIRNVESDAATLLGKDGSTYRRPTSTDTRMAHVLQDYARDLQDIVDDNVNIKGVITPELSAQLKNAQPGNQKWAEWVDKTLDGAKTVKDLRKAQAPFVRMARFAENAEAQSTNNLPTTKSAILNQAVAGIVNSNDALARRAQYNAKKADAVMASNSNGVKGKIGDVAKNIASKAGKTIGGVADMLNNDTFTNSALGNIATRGINRRIGQGEAQAVENRAALQDAQQQALDVTNNYNNAMAQAQQMYNQAQQMGTGSGSDMLDRISSGMERALAAGDINAYSQLANLYKQAYNVYEMQKPQTSKSEAKDLSVNQAKAYAGLQQLGQLSQMAPDLGTALANSPAGGLVNLFGGNEYANQAKALATTIGYLLSGANIREAEAERIGQAYVPTAFDSDNVKQQKLSRAEQLLRSYLSDTSALQ